jgi:hypothetical protein
MPDPLPPTTSGSQPPIDRRRGATSQTRTRRLGLMVAVGVGLAGAGALGLAWLSARGPGGANSAGTTGTSGGPGASGTAPMPAMPALSNTRGTSGPAGRPGASDVASVGLQAAGRARVQLTDKADRSRVVGVLEFDALEPLPDGRATLRSPRQIVFLRDGRVVEARSSQATIVRTPNSSEPESGIFEGGVEIRVYSARAASAALSAPGSSGPTGPTFDPTLADLSMTTPSLRFDRALFELSTEEAFSVRAPGVEFDGRGLRAVWNEPGSRPELIVVERRDRLVLRPRAMRARQGEATPTASGSAPSSIASGGASAPTSDPGVRVDYRAELRGSVVVRSGQRRLEAAAVEAFVAMIDNRLAPDAIAQAPGSGGGAGPSAGQSTAQSTGPGANVGDEPIELSWTGRLVVRPVEGRAPELREDLLAVRLRSGERSDDRSGERGFVRAIDDERQIDAQADGAFYGATRGVLTLTSASGDAERGAAGQGVRLRARQGELRAGSVRAELRSGVIEAPGAGRIERRREVVRAGGASARAGSDDGAGISWQNGARFVFATNGPGASSWITERLVRAEFSGARASADNAGTLEAGRLVASFDDRGSPEAALRTLSASGGVEARTARRAQAQLAPMARNTRGISGAGAGSGADLQGSSSLRAQALSVEFDATPGDAPGSAREPLATRVIASGRVVGEHRGATLRAGALDVRLLPRGGAERASRSGDVEIASVEADGGVRFEQAREPGVRSAWQPAGWEGSTWSAAQRWASEGSTQGFGGLGAMAGDRADRDGRPRVVIEGQRLQGDNTAQRVVILGDGETPAQLRTRGLALSGQRLELDGAQRRLAVPGAGRLVVARADDPRAEPGAGPPLAQAPAQLDATWTGLLRLDDRAGTGRIEGAVVAISSPTALERDELRGSSVDLAFTPSPDGQAAASTGGRASGGAERTLTRVDVVGTADAPAVVDSRRFGAASVRDRGAGGMSANAEPERLVYLSAERIVAHPGESRMEVPGPGRLLVDQRPTARGGGGGGNGGGASGATPSRTTDLSDAAALGNATGDGASLFRWQGGMALDQRAGVATMRDEVRLIHRPTPVGDAPATITTLDCSQLLAEFRVATGERDGAGGASARRAEVTRVEARGQQDVPASVRSGRQALAADELVFSPVARVVEARAARDGRVRFVDENNPQPVSASSLVWDLRSGRITIREAGGGGAAGPLPGSR